MNKRFILFVPLLCCLPLMADYIAVQHQDGSANRVQDIATIGKWVFVGDNLQLLDHAGNLLGEEPVNNITKIYFTDHAPDPTSVDAVQSSAVFIYPNPTHEVLCVQGADTNTILRIYSAEGQLVTTAQGTHIAVGNLPDGTYLLQIGTQVLRFIKQ